MKCSIIFIGGIHGAGKGFISDKLCANLSIKYLSASALIKWTEINSDTKNKSVNDIPSTQGRLITALQSTCIDGENYLLDGHYCLLNSNQEPTKIEFEIFSKINPAALLIIVADPEIIKERLAKRDNRDYDITLIEKMQSAEKEYAKEISIKLQVPLYLIDNKNIDKIIEQLKRYL